MFFQSLLCAIQNRPLLLCLPDGGIFSTPTGQVQSRRTADDVVHRLAHTSQCLVLGSPDCGGKPLDRGFEVDAARGSAPDACQLLALGVRNSDVRLEVQAVGMAGQRSEIHFCSHVGYPRGCVPCSRYRPRHCVVCTPFRCFEL